MRAGSLTTLNPTRSGYTTMLCRQLTDGTIEYHVGATASRPDGWAKLPDDLVGRVAWDDDTEVK